MGQWHSNKAALLGNFVWAALRGSWLLFAIGFVIDLTTALNLALVRKYSKAAIANADKDFLMVRYKGWTSNHLIAVIVTFALGRLLFGWLADRFYATQYSRWRVDHAVNNRVSVQRLSLCGVIFLVIAPLMLYRATQFAPDERTCL
ncbi:MAG: hypothetical protein ABJH07_05215 [Sedimentitalea sp.]|uniref:hypothetical protein n=1 Tax=Sedimentitalea sp. TaxID=2048915 RepID=UPI003265E18D